MDKQQIFRQRVLWLNMSRPCYVEQLLLPILYIFMNRNIGTLTRRRLASRNTNLQIFDKVVATRVEFGPQFVKRIQDLTILMTTIIDNGVKLSTSLFYPGIQCFQITLIPPSQLECPPIDLPTGPCRRNPCDIRPPTLVRWVGRAFSTA